MTLTDSSEAGLETLICRALTGGCCTPRPADAPPVVAEPAAPYGGVGWLPGDPADYDRDYCGGIIFFRTASLRSLKYRMIRSSIPLEYSIVGGFRSCDNYPATGGDEFLKRCRRFGPCRCRTLLLHLPQVLWCQDRDASHSACFQGGRQQLRELHSPLFRLPRGG
jgi:hypothetical protein